ncbi:hypothetical protein [Nonomuraea sp. MG754425]|nr:hypothetical protein [Nonomuraea sp. MG754425]
MSELLTVVSSMLPQVRAIAEGVFLLVTQVIGHYVIIRWLWAHRK